MDRKKSCDNLATVQSWMQKALIYSENNTFAGEIESLIAPTSNLTPKEHLAIYQRSYYARLLQCMREQYKALNHALGQDLFTDFAHQYLTVYPPSSPTLSDLGNKFASYLQETRPDQEESEKESWIDFMVDLAHFEWAVYILFDAQGHEGKAYADNATDQDKLTLQKCFSLHKFRFPVSEFYKQVSEKTSTHIPGPQMNFIGLCRKNYQIGIFTLLPQQFFFLQCVKKGHSISRAIRTTAKRFEAPREKAENAWNIWKKTWLDAGFFIDHSLSND